jgi:hypothetical protein
MVEKTVGWIINQSDGKSRLEKTFNFPGASAVNGCRLRRHSLASPLPQVSVWNARLATDT